MAKIRARHRHLHVQDMRDINWSSNHVKIMENAMLLVWASLAYNYMILKVCLPDRKLIAC